MNNQLRSINIYNGNLNKLIAECVTPVMDSLSSHIKLWFWERGCIGGKHLKVRWIEHSDSHSSITDNLLQNFSEFQKKNPSKNPVVHHPSAVKRLVETEKHNVSEAELEQKKPIA